MKDERQLEQQQQQPHSSPMDNCLPEWKSSDPYLASILRHLRATDQRLDGKLRDICDLAKCDSDRSRT